MDMARINRKLIRCIFVLAVFLISTVALDSLVFAEDVTHVPSVSHVEEDTGQGYPASTPIIKYPLTTYARENSSVTLSASALTEADIVACSDPNVDCRNFVPGNVSMTWSCRGSGSPDFTTNGGWEVTKSSGLCWNSLDVCFYPGTINEICVSPSGDPTELNMADMDISSPCSGGTKGHDKGLCTYSYDSTPGLLTKGDAGTVEDDMFRLKSGGNGFVEYMKLPTDDTYRLLYIERNGGLANKELMVPSGPFLPTADVPPRAPYEDYKRFMATAPDFITVEPACYPATFEICGGSVLTPPAQAGQCGTDHAQDRAAQSTTDPARCAKGVFAEVADTTTQWRWGCNGIDGGTNVACYAWRPIAGVCNNTVHNGCTEGTPNDAAYADTATLWRWQCNGEHGGAASPMCSMNIPVSGVCGAGNGTSVTAQPSGTAACSTGIFTEVADTSGQWRWGCNGQYGGTNVSCAATRCTVSQGSENLWFDWDGWIGGSCSMLATQFNMHGNPPECGTAAAATAPKCWTRQEFIGGTGGCTTAFYHAVYGKYMVNDCSPPPPPPPPSAVNGVCGSAQATTTTAHPASGAATCAKVTYADIADTSSRYQWRCNGINGGTTASCYSNKTVGVCNNAVLHGCSAGAFVNVVDTATHYRWRCNGIDGAANSPTCQMPKPVNGVCNNTVLHGCSAGAFVNVVDTATHYRWRCNGVSGGTNSPTCQMPKPVNGVCNNTVLHGCSAGAFVNVVDTATHYRWRCNGMSGGTNSPTCQMPKPVNGVCNNTVLHGCSAGAFVNVVDTATHYRWRCNGVSGGTNSPTCQMPKPINGVCDNSAQNACSAGTANDGAIADTATEYRWRCDGQYSGTNSGTCSITNQPPNTCKVMHPMHWVGYGPMTTQYHCFEYHTTGSGSVSYVPVGQTLTSMSGYCNVTGGVGVGCHGDLIYKCNSDFSVSYEPGTFCKAGARP